MYTITYHKQSKSYSVQDTAGKTLFRSWSEGVCQDFIDDLTRYLECRRCVGIL